MIEKLIDALGAVSADIWFFIAVGVVLFGFVGGLIGWFLGGDVGKFKKAAALVIKKPDLKNGNASAKNMPVKVTKLYKRCRASGEKPGDAIGIDACVNVPFAMSAASKFTSLTAFASLFACAFALPACSLSFVPLALVAAIGLIFTLVAAYLKKRAYAAAVSVYYEYIAALETAFGQSGYERVNLEDKPASAEAAAQPQEAYVPQPTPKKDTAAQEPPPVYAWGQESAGADTDGFVFETVTEAEAVVFEAPEPIEMELPAEEIPIINDEPITAGGAGVLTAEEMPSFDAQVFEEPAQAQTAEEPPAPSAYAPTTAADLRARSEQARAERAARAAEQAAAPPQGVSGSADELIAKIDRTVTEGASLSVIKELASQLQQERQKPENKTPEISKRLSEAQIKLIRAMSAAMKK